MDSFYLLINFNSFCNGNKLLIETLGRYQAPYDKLHLGSAGIRKLAGLFREAIYKRVVDHRPYASFIGNKHAVTSHHITAFTPS